MDDASFGVKKRSLQSKNVNGQVDGHASKSDSIHEKHQRREMEKKEREHIVLWRRPLTTLKYFGVEFSILIYFSALRLWKKKAAVALFLFFILLMVFAYYTQGPHQKAFQSIEKNLLWCAYWVGLGILSSVGLGTGLHTFLLYLGPHIASVTLAAYECMSVDFPEPPYPSDIVCPDKEELSISLWTIMSKVRLEAIMWGAGTAIGELPPYFMARAARMSGSDLDDDEFEEIEELIHEKIAHPEELGFLERAKLGVHGLVQRIGFFGILACASIPNPLFDLAGITCGHFLVPFWTFFGATLIGKAIIKMHIQKLFVIFLFSEHHVDSVIQLIGHVPRYGQSLQQPFKDYLALQKNKLHHKPGTNVSSDSNLLAWVFEKVIIAMVVYFVLSIINSMAQSYHKRLCKRKEKGNS